MRKLNKYDIEEILKDIVNRRVEYEVRTPLKSGEWSKWKLYKLGMPIKPEYDFRVKPEERDESEYIDPLLSMECKNSYKLIMHFCGAYCPWNFTIEWNDDKEVFQLTTNEGIDPKRKVVEVESKYLKDIAEVIDKHRG